MSGPRELAEQALSLLQDALRASEQRAEQLDEELKRRSLPQTPLEEQVASLTGRLETLEAECEQLRRQAGQLEDVVEAERAKAAQLKKKLEIAESGPDKLTRQEINFWRAKAEEFDQQTREYTTRIAALKRELEERAAQAASTQDDDHGSERDERLAELAAELDRVGLERNEQEQRLHRLETAANHTQDTLTERDARIAALAAELEQLRMHSRRIEDERLQLEQAQSDAREQIAGLEAELKEEKECTENLSELANERRDQLTKLEEQVEEAEERYEEARWRLGKAAHFERLVGKRNKVIRALIEAIRAKQKSNTALKAGLDGLRTYKASAEANQQKLLARIDSLKTSLGAAEESIARHQSDSVAKERLSESEARCAELDRRLDAQAEIVRSLEEELKTAKAKALARETASADAEAALADLRSELEDSRKQIDAKDRLIALLQSELDEEARELRRTTSETARLKTVNHQDKGLIDDLQREIAQLREALARRGGDAGGEVEAQINARDARIAELEDAVASWKRKYDFLAADAPAAYQSAAEK